MYKLCLKSSHIIQKHLKMIDQYNFIKPSNIANTPSSESDNYPSATQPITQPTPAKKDCHCGPEAPCRISGICSCDLLKGLVKKVEEI